jgi:hypothetical protein
MRKKNPVISNTRKFICFNNNVSNLYNNSVVEKIYGIYFYTFKCLESQIRQQLTKIKRQIVISQRPFDSRLYLDISRSFKWKESFIFRYFKYHKSSPVVCLICYYLLSVRCFCIAKIHFKSSHTRQIWNTCIVSCI